jgi:hypothetical protein
MKINLFINFKKKFNLVHLKNLGSRLVLILMSNLAKD